ncbi:hypothetical protein Mmc1_2379 [Magnetococcus marinus MC-1]|uniref:Uncharacterized protein n=1 Tax=Magnetococcus marinus (strain ATCC BAA-1437 / JCM 17883 / MC-1) TaxID=156889 RepID=A0LA86_MAGMM|nr:hypothetical protein [Magnetococcus marinus]ABK44879.1 hypothetical protein Mmc1_2379 [Magnetococcus marinus MC-1]
MLDEVTRGRQLQPDGTLKQWFQSGDMDLFIWSLAGQLVRFQLAYDRTHKERVVAWQSPGPLRHYQVDDGEASPIKNRTPLLTHSTAPAWSQIAQRLQSQAPPHNAPWLAQIVTILQNP